MSAETDRPGGVRARAADADLHRQTQLAADPRLMKESDFNDGLRGRSTHVLASAAGVHQTTLNQAMLEDLDRFSHGAAALDALVVSAACLRHARPVAMFLSLADRILPLRIFPNEQLFISPLDFLNLPKAHVRELRLSRVEPAKPLSDADPHRAGDEGRCAGPLGPMLWRLAMSGSRADLLPEIDGRACYRVSPILTITALPATPQEAQVLVHMRSDSLTLDDMARHPGMTPERASRLLNAVYLQAGLMTIRSSPRARAPRKLAKPLTEQPAQSA